MRPALIIAHPGHELRVHRWMELHRPRVYVLTDGSGATGVSRVRSCRAVLAAAGAVRGPVFCDLSDRDIYSMMLAGDFTAMLDIAAVILEDLIRHGVTHLVGDAWEGYNPTHDLCRVLINALADRLGFSDPLANMAVRLVGAPTPRPGCVTVALDAAALSRKLEAARGYDGLMEEVTLAVAAAGEKSFAREYLEPLPAGAEVAHLHRIPPYEAVGQARVDDGKYGVVLRYREHFLPMARGLVTGLCSSPGILERNDAVDDPAHQQYA
jgi:hypothetical protein